VTRSDSGQQIHIRSKLRIFLSLDIVGSTEFKQPRTHKEPEHEDSWVRPFLAFYRLSVDEMNVQWDRVVAEIRKAKAGNSDRFVFGDCPEFWKGQGDEVLFSKVVVSPLDAVAAVHALMRVMNAHRAQFESKPQTKLLNVKGAAWLAGFPLNNAEIVVAADSSSTRVSSDDRLTDNYRLLSELDNSPELRAKYKADYIGPSIDLGFRIREHATSRRLVASADLVWLLCRADHLANGDERTACAMMSLPKIGYLGRKPLKGILAGDPYPIFWIESEESSALDEAEDKLLNRIHHSVGTDVAAYCETYLDGSGPLRMVPYIPGCSDAVVGVVAEEKARKVQRLQDYVNGMATTLETLGYPDDPNAGSDIPAEATAFANEQTLKSTPQGDSA